MTPRRGRGADRAQPVRGRASVFPCRGWWEVGGRAARSEKTLTGSDGTPVRHARRLWVEVEHVEGTAAPAVTREEFQYDGFGNVTVHSEWGLVEDGDLLARGDERITTTTCLNDTASWLLGRASRVIVADAHGRREFETRTFYDGPAFVGLPLGGDRTWGMVSGPILVP